MTNRTFLLQYSHGWHWDEIREETRTKFDAYTAEELPYRVTTVLWSFETAQLCIALADCFHMPRSAVWSMEAPIATRPAFAELYGIRVIDPRPASAIEVPWKMFGQPVRYHYKWNRHSGRIGALWLEKPDETYEIQLDVERCAAQLLDEVDRYRRAA